MNLKRSACLFVLGITLVIANIPGTQSAAKAADAKSYDLYLLIGQSNMAGRGKATDADRKAHPRVFKLDKQNKWVPATAPLHFDKPRIAGVGPGDGFGRAMAAAAPDANIGLVPCAVGGTPLRRWVKGGDLYEKAVKRAKVAMKHGTFKGVIWHQGESDSRSAETAGSYGKRLSKMIADLRSDLNAPDLPFVAGELGQFLSKKTLPHWETVNTEIKKLPESVAHMAVAKSNGLKAKRDRVHFDADSAREFGKRYAAAMIVLQAKTTSHTEEIAVFADASDKLDDGIEKKKRCPVSDFCADDRPVVQTGGRLRKIRESQREE